MKTNKSKRKQPDIHIIAEPATLEWLAQLFGCNEDQAAEIVAHVATNKKEGELCQLHQNYTQ